MVFCMKTCVQFPARDVITQPVTANSLCFCACAFFFKLEGTLSGRRVEVGTVLSSGAVLALAGRGVSPRQEPPVTSGRLPPFTLPPGTSLKGTHVSEEF